MERQHDPKINRAIKISFKYKPKTVIILNKKPKAANIIVHRNNVILPLKFINCFFHSGGTWFS